MVDLAGRSIPGSTGRSIPESQMWAFALQYGTDPSKVWYRALVRLLFSIVILTERSTAKCSF